MPWKLQSAICLRDTPPRKPGRARNTSSAPTRSFWVLSPSSFSFEVVAVDRTECERPTVGLRGRRRRRRGQKILLPAANGDNAAGGHALFDQCRLYGVGTALRQALIVFGRLDHRFRSRRRLRDHNLAIRGNSKNEPMAARRITAQSSTKLRLSVPGSRRGTLTSSIARPMGCRLRGAMGKCTRLGYRPWC